MPKFVGHFGANGGILPRFGGHFGQNLGHFAPAGGAMAPLAPPLDQPLLVWITSTIDNAIMQSLPSFMMEKREKKKRNTLSDNPGKHDNAFISFVDKTPISKIPISISIGFAFGDSRSSRTPLSLDGKKKLPHCYPKKT